MIGVHIIAAMFLAQAAPAAAPTAAAQAATPAPASADSTSSTVSPLEVTGQKPVSKRREVDLKEVVCQDEVPPGSRFSQRVCATRGQFIERTRVQQEMVREWQNTPITTRAQ